MSTNRLSELRQAAGLTAREVGEKVGAVERTVYRWETGDTGIPDAKKLALADLFGVSVPWLMGWEDNGSTDGEQAAA